MQPNTLVPYTFFDRTLQLFFSSLLICMFFSSANAQLEYEWANRLDDANITNTDSFSIEDIATDPSGNILITGSFKSGAIDFDLGPGVQNLPHGGSNQKWIFIVKYDPNGNYLWGHSLGSNFVVWETTSYGIATDGAGNILITGSIKGEVDFDPAPLDSNILSTYKTGLPSGYDDDIFLAKYDPNGNHLWAFKVGGKSIDCVCCNNCGPDIGYDVEVASNGYIAITGQFTQTADFDPS
ncbi:MAG: hypothetical protein GY810_23745, partial [Aureispira sp.]|nr:hypothetical protein [Aureispira sp.]